MSDKPQLEAPIGLPQKSGTPYRVVVQITDTKTGVQAIHRYALYVSGAIGAGWMILEISPEGADLSLIERRDTEETLRRNLYSTINPEHLLSNDVTTLRAVSGNGKIQYVFVTGGQEGGIQLTQTGMEFIRSYSDLFYETPSVLRPDQVIYTIKNLTSFCAQIINNGRLYYTYNGGSNWGLEKMVIEVGGDYELAPFGAQGMGLANLFLDLPVIYFDQKNGRFLFLGASNALTLTTFSPTVAQDFDLNNVPGKMKYMSRGMNNVYSALIEDNGTFSLYMLNATFGTNHNNVVRGYQKIQNSPAMANADFFALAYHLPLLYYTSGNQVYLYDITANSSRPIYTFPAGEEITAFKLEAFQPEAGIGLPASPYEGKRLVVGTYSGTEGRLYYLDLENNGEVIGNTYARRFEGLGKIISLAYKQL